MIDTFFHIVCCAVGKYFGLVQCLYNLVRVIERACHASCTGFGSRLVSKEIKTEQRFISGSIRRFDHSPRRIVLVRCRKPTRIYLPDHISVGIINHHRGRAVRIDGLNKPVHGIVEEAGAISVGVDCGRNSSDDVVLCGCKRTVRHDLANHSSDGIVFKTVDGTVRINSPLQQTISHILVLSCQRGTGYVRIRNGRGDETAESIIGKVGFSCAISIGVVVHRIIQLASVVVDRFIH